MTKQKILINVGISASGKSTDARKLVDEGWIRLNRDDARKSVINLSLKEYWSGPKEIRDRIENIVTAMLDAALINAVKNNYNVVIDNTHLNPKYITDILNICKKNCSPLGFEWYVKLYDTPVEICIERDKNREDSVGESVIRRQASQRERFQYQSCNTWNEYTPHIFDALVFDPSKPKAILCDLDGTVAQMVGRSPFDWKRVGEDVPKQTIIDIVNTSLQPNWKLVFMSGRDDVCRPETTKWINTHFKRSDFDLYMRPRNDMRPDDIIKYEILRDKIAPNYYPVVSFDDRDRVVKLIRNMGIICLQVADGNF